MSPGRESTATSAIGRPIGPGDISVLICAFDEERLPITDLAIAALQRQTATPGEILVVIDHNAELFAIARERWAGTRVIENPGPRGSSAARNVAVAASSGAVVAYIDDDAIPEDDWVAALVAAYGDPGVTGVGGLVEPLWEQPRPRWLPAEFDWVVSCSYRGLPTTGADVRNFIGANMSFLRTAFDAAGGFDPAFSRVGSRPLGIDDTELCLRLSRTVPGARLRHDPAARVRHHVPRRRSTLRYFLTRCRCEGMSKALLTRVGSAPGALATERSYTLRVLPSGIVGNLAAAVRQRDAAALARAGAIVLGLGATAVGFLHGLLSPDLRRHAILLRASSS